MSYVSYPDTEEVLANWINGNREDACVQLEEGGAAAAMTFACRVLEVGQEDVLPHVAHLLLTRLFERQLDELARRQLDEEVEHA